MSKVQAQSHERGIILRFLLGELHTAHHDGA